MRSSAGRLSSSALVAALLCATLLPARQAQAAEASAGTATTAASPPKKEDKARRAARQGPRFKRAASSSKPRRVVSLVNLWTAEVLPVIDGKLPSRQSINKFLRCHFTGHATAIDARLLKLAVAAATRFKSDRVEIISAYRHPKYNLMLRKKGREVAGGSNHMKGHALDFRIPGTSTLALRTFALGAGLGGVGYYPKSRFVHVDVGKRRTWRGK